MTSRALIVILLISCWLPAAADEAYPGQNNLAAGLTCYRNLDYDSALARLETALSEFSPEKDPDYLKHVSEARLTLAMIYVARDNLGKAEKEFKTLLILIPDYDLPKGDHPPKVRYIFDRAKKSVTRLPVKKTVPVPSVSQPSPSSALSVPGSQSEGGPDPEIKPPPPVVKQPAPPSSQWSLSAQARLVALFGEDAEKAQSGPGAALAFGLSTSNWLTLQIAFAYSHHPAVEEDTALQTMSLSMDGLVTIDLLPVELRLGGGVGVLAMGTDDRYDHWGFTLQATAAVAWPASGSWALVLGLHPSVLVAAGGSSFFLPAGLSGELRW
jgi:tetratricopeptide (TPR) repeat protein